MKIERTKNTVRNSIWGVISTILNLFLPFINRTVLIKCMGVDYLGLTSLFSSILQMLNLAECGFSSAIVFSMYKPIAEDNLEEICTLLNFYKKVYRIIGTVIFVIGFCCLPFLKQIISGSYPKQINIYIIYLLYLANTSISYFLFAYKNSILSAHQRNDIQHKILLSCRILQFIFQFLCIIFFKNFYLYIICTVLFTVVNNLLTSKAVSKIYPNYICRGQLKKEQSNEIKEKVAGLIIIKLAQTTRDSLDSIFISKFLGLASVAVFSNYFYILTAVHGLIQVVATSMSAGIGNSIASESKEKNYLDFRKFIFLYLWIATCCIACMICLYQPFMEFWVGKELMLDFNVVILLCVYFWLLAIGDIKGNYIGALGLWWKCKTRAILETFCNCMLNYFFVKKYGYTGIIFATILTVFFLNYIYDSFILFRNFFTEYKILKYFFEHFLYTLTCTTTSIICFIMTKVIRIPIFLLNFALQFLVIIFIVNLILLLCYRKTIIFKESFKIIINIVPKKIRGILKHYEK